MLGVKGGCAGKDTPKCGFLCEAEQLAMKDTSRRCFACHRNHHIGIFAGAIKKTMSTSIRAHSSLSSSKGSDPMVQ